jgi:hypothetical protein
MLHIAAALTVLVGLYHSLAGEHRLIRPLLALEGLPALGGGPGYTRALIRTAWHLTTLTWFGLAAMMVHVQLRTDRGGIVFLWIVAAVFALSGLLALVFGRGRHPSWLAFLPVAILAGSKAWLLQAG